MTVRPPTLAAGSDFEICIPHARTNAVSSMIMSIGRSTEGIAVPGREMRIHYIFAVGVPTAWAADYLRIVGALARMFKNPKAEAQLRSAGIPRHSRRFCGRMSSDRRDFYGLSLFGF